jgi:hypothetical protein
MTKPNPTIFDYNLDPEFDMVVGNALGISSSKEDVVDGEKGTYVDIDAMRLFELAIWCVNHIEGAALEMAFLLKHVHGIDDEDIPEYPASSAVGIN